MFTSHLAAGRSKTVAIHPGPVFAKSGQAHSDPLGLPRIQRKHGYLPDLQEEAVKTVLAQAELLCADGASS